MSNINSIGNNGELPEKPKTNTETAPSYNNTIFKDLNDDGIIDREDFKNNNALIDLIEKNCWLGEKWNKYGNAINKLLKSFNLESKEEGKDAINKIVQNCDIKNGSEVTLAINAIYNELSDNPDELEAAIKKLFGEQFERMDTYRDGGSLEIKLKDGSSIYMDYSINSMMSGSAGSSTITHADGNEENFDVDGNPI